MSGKAIITEIVPTIVRHAPEIIESVTTTGRAIVNTVGDLAEGFLGGGTPSTPQTTSGAPLQDRATTIHSDILNLDLVLESAGTSQPTPASRPSSRSDEDSSSPEPTPLPSLTREQLAAQETRHQERLKTLPFYHPTKVCDVTVGNFGRGICAGLNWMRKSGTRGIHYSPSHVHHQQKEQVIQQRQAYKDASSETQEYLEKMPGVKSDLLPRHLEGRKNIDQVLEEGGISTFRKYPELCTTSLHLEDTTRKKGRIPGVQAVHPMIAVAIDVATRLAYKGDKNFKQLRHPSCMLSGPETHEIVSKELAKGTKDNNMNTYLMSFSFGLLSSSRHKEGALYGMTKWNATSPAKVLEKIMTPTLKDMGLNNDEIKELLESTAWKTLIEHADSIEHSELLFVSLPKEKVDSYAYVSGRYGKKTSASMDELVSDRPPEDILISDGEAQFRLVCSKDSMSPDADIEMFLLNLDREKVAEHLKDEERPSLDSSDLGKLFPEKQTKEEQAAQDKWAGCSKLIQDFVDLAKAKAKEKQTA